MSDDAAKRAAARKAKILARGNAGLQKLAQTARGEEAEKLYGGDSASSSRPETPSGTPSTQARAPKQPSSSNARAGAGASDGPSWAPPPATASGATGRGRPGVTPEQQQMADQMEAMMAMLGGAGGPGGPGGGAGGEGVPDMSKIFAQMMGMDPSAMGGAPGQNLLGDLDDPAGLGGAPPGFPPNPFGSMFGNMPGMGPMGGMGGVPQGKKWVEKVWPVVHALMMVLFVAMVVLFWEPSLRAAKWGGVGGLLSGNSIGRYAKLSGRRGVLGKAANLAGIGGPDIIVSAYQGTPAEDQPFFWAFTTLELMLQTTRFFILRSPPPPHSLIQTFLPLLPPRISKPIVTGSRYLTMLLQLYKDGALVVFLLGMVIILAEYLNPHGLVV